MNHTNQQSLLVARAALELEELRLYENNINSNKNITGSNQKTSNRIDVGRPFPRACKELVRNLPGNTTCIDCSRPTNPEWASVTYGTVLCMKCCGKHRSYGVQVSFTRSIDMDSWTYTQIMSLLEGGNDQLRTFFERNQLSATSSISSVSSSSSSSSSSTASSISTDTRYQTRAAKFYKHHLSKHVQMVRENGLYQGREVNRSRSTDTNTSAVSKTTSSNVSTNAATANNINNKNTHVPTNHHHQNTTSSSSAMGNQVCVTV